MSKVIKKPQHRSYTTQPYPPIAMPATAPTSQAPSQTHSQAVSPVNTTDRTSAPWAAEDDKILMEARAQGQNWAPIAELHFPRKTPNACRKRHERLMEKRNADSWDGTVKVEDLARAYMDCRKEMWKILAEKVNEKWELVEIKCMEKGLKNLQTASRRSNSKPNPPSPRSHRSDEEPFNDSGLGRDGDSPGGNDAGGGTDQPPSHPGGTSHSHSPPDPPPTSGPSASTTYNYNSSTLGGAYDFLPAPVMSMQSHQTLPGFRTSFETSFEMPSIDAILQKPPSMMMHS
ncbi:hypothetical protein MMC24_005067 [Lignoscripta atroalba]|nr:hypothetical protein [Lignoscripta atroalba]